MRGVQELGLISLVKMSSSRALATAWSRRVSSWARVFSFAANKHRQGVVLIAGDGDATDGVLVADGDFPELDEFFDMRQEQANRIWLGSGAWVYAAA